MGSIAQRMVARETLSSMHALSPTTPARRASRAWLSIVPTLHDSRHRSRRPCGLRNGDAWPASGEARQCLVSGAAVTHIESFPQIRKVPGKNTAKGISLVSFNANAFESYGWEGNENAPVCRAAAEACATALNRLLDPAYPDPHNPGQALPERRLRLSADTVVCFWAAGAGGNELCDIPGGLLEANPERVGEVYRSVWRGRETVLSSHEETAFYSLTLTGQRGRAVVRDWFESTVANVSRNLAAYFADLNVVRNARSRAETVDAPLPMSLLLESSARWKPKRGRPLPSHARVRPAQARRIRRAGGASPGRWHRRRWAVRSANQSPSAPVGPMPEAWLYRAR